MQEIEQTLDSREVAEMVKKTHKELLRDIRRYCEQLGESKIALTEFFSESTYVTEQNKTMPCYLVTKKGCEFIAHKLTGIKGTEFTARYINRFHDMEEQITNPLDSLSTELRAVIVVDKRVTQIEKKADGLRQEFEEFKEDMPILGIEEDRITCAVKKKGVKCLGGKASNAYNDRSLRGKLYSDLYQQLYRQFGITTYKAIKRNQCDRAVGVIEGYEPPFILGEQIKDCNAQMSMEVQGL